jgi:hypothetical protein
MPAGQNRAERLEKRLPADSSWKIDWEEKGIGK